MDTWVLSKEKATRFHREWMFVQGVGGYAFAAANARRRIIDALLTDVQRELQELEPTAKFFVNSLTENTDDTARDIDFVILRVTPGRQTRTVLTSLLAELSIHDATLPKER